MLSRVDTIELGTRLAQIPGAAIGQCHEYEAGERVALLRACDPLTGAEAGAIEMPDKQTGSPITYMINGKQYIVVAVSGVDGAQLIAYALP